MVVVGSTSLGTREVIIAAPQKKEWIYLRGAKEGRKWKWRKWKWRNGMTSDGRWGGEW